MIDYHCHLLPGLDDGPETADEALAMARALAAFGFREVCCTPHCIKGHYESSPVEVREAVRKLQSRLDYEGVALTLHSGMEYYLDEYFEQYAANLLPLGESRLVLCESPLHVHPGLVAEMLGLIVVQGYLPLIAHPERSDVIWTILEAGFEERDPRHEKSQKAVPDAGAAVRGQAITTKQDGPATDQEPRTASLMQRLFSRKPRTVPPEPRTAPPESVFLPESCLFQANLGSFTGYYGPLPQRLAYELLQRGVYHCLASDLHEARSAASLLELAREKVAFNPALQKLGTFIAPQGQGGSDQLAFW